MDSMTCVLNLQPASMSQAIAWALLKKCERALQPDSLPHADTRPQGGSRASWSTPQRSQSSTGPVGSGSRTSRTSTLTASPHGSPRPPVRPFSLACLRSCSSLIPISPLPGMFLWISTGFDTHSFTLSRALGHGFLAVPGKAFFPSLLHEGARGHSTHLRVSCSIIEPEVADEGFRRLAVAIREARAEAAAAANGADVGVSKEACGGEL